MQGLVMSRKKENGNVAIPATSELCSNSLARSLRGNGKGECWPRVTSRTPAAKAGNTAIPFQSEINKPPGTGPELEVKQKVDPALRTGLLKKTLAVQGANNPAV